MLLLAISIVVSNCGISKGLSNQQSSNIAVTTPNKLLTLKQVSSYLGLSQNQVMKLISTSGHEIDSDLPHLRIGRTYYFDKQAVNNWIESNRDLDIP